MALRSALLALTILCTASPGITAPPQLLEGYRGVEDIGAATRALAGSHGDRVAVRTLGRSREGREILLLTLGRETSGRPALLIASGLDGTHALGPELAFRVAERLLRDHAELLERTVVHVLAIANPDAIEATRRGPHAVSTVARPVDDDRDGQIDEDPPVDLDGDGAILTMRIRNPPPPFVPTLVVDDKDPRLLRAPDPAKGERAEYLLLAESIDADGDGRFGEDGPGGVDLDRNFPHRWPEFAPDAGPFQISESESKLLADFVIATPELVAALVYGRHDSLVTVPDTRDMDTTGRTPMVYLAADHPLYQSLGTLYRETTGEKRASAGDPAGSFWLWLANHRGLLAIAANGWGRPDAPPPETPPDAPDEETPEAATTEPPPAEADAPPAAPPPEAAPARPGPGRRGGRGGRPPAPPRQVSRPVDAELADWMDYLERDREGLGYVAWHSVPHPFFGTVEVGGVDPLATRSPPAAALDELAEKQTAFVAELLARMPALDVTTPVVTRLGPELYRIESSVTNVGRLPTSTAMARTTRTLPPLIARVSVPVERVIEGERVRRIDGINPGERIPLAWILRTEPGERVEMSVGSVAFPTRRFVIENGQLSEAP